MAESTVQKKWPGVGQLWTLNLPHQPEYASKYHGITSASFPSLPRLPKPHNSNFEGAVSSLFSRAQNMILDKCKFSNLTLIKFNLTIESRNLKMPEAVRNWQPSRWHSPLMDIYHWATKTHFSQSKMWPLPLFSTSGTISVLCSTCSDSE